MLAVGMDSFEYLALALRNRLARLWSAFARFMDRVSIGESQDAYVHGSECRRKSPNIFTSPRYWWVQGNVYNPDN